MNETVLSLGWISARHCPTRGDALRAACSLAADEGVSDACPLLSPTFATARDLAEGRLDGWAYIVLGEG